MSELPALRAAVHTDDATPYQLLETTLAKLLALFALSVTSTQVAQNAAGGRGLQLMIQSSDSAAVNEKSNGQSAQTYSCLSRLL